MPVKPTYAAAKYSATPKGMDLLNVIRAEASNQYKEWIPQATQDNIKEVGNPILKYQAAANEFLSALVNRIGLVLITSRTYNNPLKPFKRGEITLGETIEEIFVNIIKAEPYYREDDLGMTNQEDLFKQRIPDVRAVFHSRNRQDKFPITISNDDLRTAFISYQGVEDLVGKMIEAVYTSDEYAEFLLMKNIFLEAGNRGAIYPVAIPDPTDEATGKQAMTAIRKAALDLTFMSDKYNYMGVTTHTPIGEQYIFMLTSLAATVDVEVLASAFNMDKADFIGRRVIVDDFGGLEKEGVVALTVDREWFMVFDNYLAMTEVYNGARLYWNYFLHHWQTLSYSPFKNAIAFTTQAPAVTDVAVTPGTASLTKAAGGTIQFKAVVTGTGLISPEVTWTVTEDANASIDANGLLTVKAGITVDTLTVTAASKTEPTKTDTATVTLT